MDAAGLWYLAEVPRTTQVWPLREPTDGFVDVHTPGALYDVFPPAEAKRLADKLEIHHTPKHGSWLNIAEIE